MGKALLIIVLGFSTIVSTLTLSLNRHSLESVNNYSDYFKIQMARNAATSGVYMAIAKLAQDSTWRTGYSNLQVGNSNFSVDIQDNNEDPNLTSMELRIISAATYEDISKTTTVLVGVPPKLSDLAVFCTDTIINVTPKNESGNPDWSLAIQNAPDMLPYDKNGLAALAIAQGHVQASDFTPGNNYPNGSFYFNAASNIPNVTHVYGNLSCKGGRTVYGIFIVEGNTTLEGSARLEGVIYMPNPGSIVIHGGGNPSESSITGGIFANGYINGTGSHISVKYDSDFMEIFGQWQLVTHLYIISWKETPDY